MSDKIITKAIVKTYFIILSFLLFIFLTLTFLFIVFQNGLHIKELSILNVHIEQLYIKWDEKVDVSVKEIAISSKKELENNAFDYKLLSNYLKALRHTTNWFESIIIESIKIKEFDISFKYKQNSQGFLIATSPSLLISSTITYNKDILNIEINDLNDKEKKILGQGNIYIDLNTQKGFSNLHLNINNDANLTLYSSIDTNQMNFAVRSENEIQDVKYLIKLASLPKEIKFWTQDAITLDSMDIQTLKGTLDFNNFENAYKNIYVKAKANELLYTYNTELDGVQTRYTDLEFKHGVLFIRPKQAFSYGTSLGESWLKIDFTTKEELLTLQLLFDGQLDKGMLKVLNAYKIKLPFLQRQGRVSTDLKIIVNLMSIDVDAQGSFYTKKANFDYLGLNIDIFDTEILLDNYNVQIDKMKAKYKDIAKADVRVLYDAKRSEGKIDFSFNDIVFNKLQLNKNTHKLHATYTISPTQDLISVEKSTWNIGKQELSVDPIVIPFDLKALTLSLPTTFLKLTDVSSGFIEGSINLNNYTSELSLDILKLSYEGLEFSQSNTSFDIKYADKLSVSSSDKLFFNISGTEYVIDNPSFVMDKESLVLKNTKLKIGQYATTKIYAKHSLTDMKTHVSLSNFIIKNYRQDKVLYKKKKILLAIKNKENSLEVSSKELGATATSSEKGWNIHLNSIAQIATNSEPLQKLHLNKGDFTLYKNKDDKYVQFISNISYPYKILTKDNKPTKLYTLEGKLKNDSIYLKINKNTRVDISDRIEIKTKNSGININEILRFTQDLKQDEGNDTVNVKFDAIDSYLYISDTRKVISELINLQYINDILTVQLKHQKGKAGLRLKGKEFHLYGQNFNDKFMQELFYLSKFKGGRLDFSMDGTTDEYDGVFYITGSTIIDYKVLNNILAFINTVPSLVTFSLPGYSDNGLYTEQAYLKFMSKDNLFNLSDIYLESKELSILGNGKANFQNDTIDVNLNLKTDLGSDASKIPLVGYILFDKESVSTTLKIKGKLSDPKIESQLAHDIAVAPLNIIKRTLTLPYNMLKNLKLDANESK
jgi:AsmA-like C-terminal region